MKDVWNNDRWEYKEYKEKQGFFFNLVPLIFISFWHYQFPSQICDLCCWIFLCFFCLAKLSWSKTLVRKWFNIKSKNEEFQADEVVYGGEYILVHLGSLTSLMYSYVIPLIFFFKLCQPIFKIQRISVFLDCSSTIEAGNLMSYPLFGCWENLRKREISFHSVQLNQTTIFFCIYHFLTAKTD